MEAIKKIVNNKLHKYNILDTGVSIEIAKELHAFIDAAVHEVSIVAQTATPIYAQSNSCMTYEDAAETAVHLLDACLQQVDKMMLERIEDKGKMFVS